MLLMPVVFAVTISDVVRLDGPAERVAPMVVLLITVMLAVVVRPLVDAAISRASERAADSYAVVLGAGPDLADALQQVGPRRPCAFLARATNPHLASPSRQRRLTGELSPG
jgi:STE24 endopeptidase